MPKPGFESSGMERGRVGRIKKDPLSCWEVGSTSMQHSKHAIQGHGAKLGQRRVELGDDHQAEKDPCVHEQATKGGGPAWTACIILHKLIQLG